MSIGKSEKQVRRSREELAEKMANLFFDFWIDKDFRFGKENIPEKVTNRGGYQPASQATLGLEEFS